jgi:uncharacterized metal-binding protein
MEAEIVLLSTSRMVLGLIQCPIQCVHKALAEKGSRELKVTTYLLVMLRMCAGISPHPDTS